MKVLVADATTVMRRAMINVLKSMNLTNVAEAGNGLEALDRLESDGPFDLLVSDWNMPLMAGAELLRRVKESQKYKALQVIIVSAEADRATVMEAIRSGAADYIIKPYDAETAIKHIKHVLKLS